MFSKGLKRIRMERGLTQADLANALCVSTRTVFSWEAGERKPDIDMLSEIADFFSVSVDYLLERTDDPAPRVYRHALQGTEGEERCLLNDREEAPEEGVAKALMIDAGAATQAGNFITVPSEALPANRAEFDQIVWRIVQKAMREHS